MEDTSLQGPVLMVNGKLTLMIPLEDGGADFLACSRGISEVEGAQREILQIARKLADSGAIALGNKGEAYV